MTLLRNIQRRANPSFGETPTPVIDLDNPLQPVAQSRIARAAGVYQGTVARGVMAALPENYMKSIIDARDQIPNRSRSGGNEDGYIHVSSLINACARREVIAALHDPLSFSMVTGGHRLMWKFGRIAEEHIRDEFIAGTDARGVYGRWECRCARTFHVGMRPNQTQLCSHCQFPMKKFRENPMYSDTHGLVGNADLPFMLGDYAVITEVKSMNSADWEKLKAPMGDHVTQAGSYRRLYEEAGWKVHNEAIIIYAKKEFKFGSPYKEYHVNCTTTTVQRQVGMVFEAGRLIKEHREAGTLPPRTVCQMHTCKQAKACPQVGLCFSLEG